MRYCGPTADSNSEFSTEVWQRAVEEVVVLVWRGIGESDKMDSNMVVKIARSRSVMVEYVGSMRQA